MDYAIINTAIAPLRKSPSNNSELTDEDLYGHKVEILARPLEDWYHIKTEYRYDGFIHKSHLYPMNCLDKEWERTEKKIVSKAYADILTQPKIQSHCIISLTKGAVIGGLNERLENGWSKVLLCNGTIGYIRQKFLMDYKRKIENLVSLSLASKEKLRSDIVKTACTYLGTQYRWGGKSPLGMDCSGLCFMAYWLNGITIFRDAVIKEDFPIHKILYEEKKPCDLLYFPGHVAMYLGNDKYLHATGKAGSDGVVINSLSPLDMGFREDLYQSLYAVGSVF